MEEWAMESDTASLRAITALSQDYASEIEVAEFLIGNPIIREAFLAFCDWFFGESPQVRVGKVATRWMKRCLTAREHDRLKKEDYIEQVLVKMWGLHLNESMICLLLFPQSIQHIE